VDRQCSRSKAGERACDCIEIGNWKVSIECHFSVSNEAVAKVIDEKMRLANRIESLLASSPALMKPFIFYMSPLVATSS